MIRGVLGALLLLTVACQVEAQQTLTATLQFLDNADNEDGFVFQRCAAVGCSFTDDFETIPASPGSGLTVTYVDPTAPLPVVCYRVRAKSVALGDSVHTAPACREVTPAPPTGFEFGL